MPNPFWRRGASKELTVYHGWTGYEHTPVVAMLQKFMKNNPGMKVNVQEMAWETLRVEIASRIDSDPPDVFPREVGLELSELMRAEKLADLTDVWNRGDLYEAFPDWITESCTLDHRMLAIPVKFYTFAVWYIPEVFRKYKLSPPRDWNEFLEICNKLRKSGITPIVASPWGSLLWFNHLLLGIGGLDFYNRLMRGKERWVDTRVVEAYELLKELTHRFFLPHPFAYNFPETWEKVQRREAAMILQGDWVNGMWQHRYGCSPGVDYDFFLLPPVYRESRFTLVVGGNVWVVPKRARNLEGAKQFLAYAASLEAQELMARKNMGILARKDVPEKVYDPVLVRLRRELFSRRTAFTMGMLLPWEVLAAEERVRREAVLAPETDRRKLADMLYQLDAIVEAMP